jgi:dynein heavy chain
MEKLFNGIASTGSWTCLDEFNRIDLEVLSVISSQILVLREALLENKTSLNFFGKNIILNAYMGIFITFNPGYSGRSELPENLKMLFRPVSMMIPDYAMIAQNLLYSEGF